MTGPAGRPARPDVGDLLRAAVADSRRAGRSRRHPAETTADRLADALDRWPDAWDGTERDAVALVRHVLLEIAEGQR